MMKTNKKDLKFSSLEKTLIFWFVLISFVPLIMVSSIGYYHSRSIITQEAQNRLRLNTQIEAKHLNTITSKVVAELEIIAKNKSNIHFMTQLSLAFKQSKKPLKAFVRSYDWLQIADEGGKDLQAFQKNQGYYDILLIDPQGNLIFSVGKEADLGSNIFDGEYSNTLLSEAVANVMLEGEITFSDFEYHPGSRDVFSAFFVRDMIDDLGQRVGFVAIQIDSARLQSSLVKETGQNKSLSTYLIGSDLKLRFGSFQGEGYLEKQKTVDTKLIRRWHTHNGIQSTIEQQPSQKVLSYTNPSGKEVLGFDTRIEMVGKKFLLVAEIEKKEAYRAAFRLRNISIAMILFTVLIVVLIAVKVSRRIVIPVKELTRSVGRVASGNFNEKIQIKSDNEIGILAQSYNRMVDNLKQTIQTMEDEISKRKSLEKKANEALEATWRILENLPMGLSLWEGINGYDL